MNGFYVFNRLVDIDYGIPLFFYDVGDNKGNTVFSFDYLWLAKKKCKELNNE